MAESQLIKKLGIKPGQKMLIIPDSLGGKNIGIPMNQLVCARVSVGADKSAVGAINRPLRPVHTCEVKEYGESVQIRVFC